MLRLYRTQEKFEYPLLMELDWIRRYCLSLPSATEQVRWSHNLVFKVGGKMFAIANLEPAATCLAFKCAPEDFADLIERPLVIPAPYLARAHWVALESYDALSPAEIERLLRDAYGLVVAKLPKAIQQKLHQSRPRENRQKRKRRARR